LSLRGGTLKESAQQRESKMLQDKRLIYAVAAVVVILVIGYAGGWFSGNEPEPAQQEESTN
jgi:hypothetical protein